MNPLETALLAAAEQTAEPVGPPITVQVDLDRAAVILGDPGLYDGLAIARWSRPESRDE